MQRCPFNKTLTRFLSLHSLTPYSLRTMSAGSTQRMFQLKLDPLTGNSEWVVVEEDDTSEDSHKLSLAYTSYLDMLNDTPRNRAYRRAIEKTVTKPCHVLDIGAGTGLLSMMAARAMDCGVSSASSSSKGTVTACESYLPMVKLMRKVLRANGMERKVRIINKRSDELQVGLDITSRADILVSEILDSELLGEGLIPTLQHAHDNLLVENFQTVPYRATIYGQLVESKYLWKLHDLFNNEAKVSYDIRLVPKGMETILGVKPQQFAFHCDALREDIKLLSEPFKVFEFDFWKRPDTCGRTELQILATNAGNVHAVISWWILQLDSEGEIFYSTAPKWIDQPLEVNGLQSSLPSAKVWCDHWKQSVWFSSGEGVPVHTGDDVYLDAIHTCTTILYDFKAQTQSSQDSQIFLSPERVAIYGDRSWRDSLFIALKNSCKTSPLCLVADDSVFLAIAIAHLSKTSKVMALFPGLGEKGSQYLQAVAVENGFSMDRVEVLRKKISQLSIQDTNQKKVDILIGEPFYYGSEGRLPWQNLRFWKERTMLGSILSDDALIMPCKGVLKACAMHLPDLWRSRYSLKDIEGFDHRLVNDALGACGGLPASQESPCLPFFIWQCGEVKKVSGIHTVMEFDFFKPISPCSGKVEVEITDIGTCHGFALWIDWVMDLNNSIILSTGPDQRQWKQGVKLLTEPVIVGSPGAATSVCIEAFFNPSSGELAVNHTFQ